MTTIQDLYNYLDDVDAGLEDLRGAVNLALDHLPWFVPGWVVDKVHEKWNELMATADTELAAFRTRVDEIGEPWKLRPAADEWSTGVKADLSPLPGRIAWSQLTSDDVFAGESAEAYRQIMRVQKDAVSAVGGFPDPISTGLDDIASAIDTWTIAYGVAILALLGGIASAIVAVATSETGVGLLVGIGAAIVCFVALASAVFVAENEMNNAVETVEGSWNLALANWENFDGESWPAATFPA